MTHIEKLHLDAMIVKDLQAAIKSAAITEDIAIEFAEFISNHRLDFQPSTLGGFIGLDMKSYTAKELFQEYLKTKENETPNN
jgi:hypothetical protein